MDKPLTPLRALPPADKEAFKQQMAASWERDKIAKETNAKGKRQVSTWRDDSMNVE